MWGPLFRISHRPGFSTPFSFSNMSTRAIYHRPRRKSVLAVYIRPGNNIQWYLLKVRISSRLCAPIDHTLILVYSIPVKCPDYKVSSVQQFYSILIRCWRCSNALVLAILPDAALFPSRCLPSTIPTQRCRKRHQTWSVDGLTEPRTHFIIFIRGKY